MHPHTKLRTFEFRIRQHLESVGIDLLNRRILVACSGGADSVALAHLMKSLASRLHFTFALAHIHHGESRDAAVFEFRSDAQRFVRALGIRLEVPVLTNDGRGLRLDSQSESTLRDFRKVTLSTWRSRGGVEETSAQKSEPKSEQNGSMAQTDFKSASQLVEQGEAFTDLAFGHHADDLLETRLMRLIRGTGARGLSAMRESRPGVLRPLLSFSQKEIRNYLQVIGADWIEDPSNTDTRYFRNWMRHKWLPQLEAFRPAAGLKLAKSLDRIVGEIEASHLTRAPLPAGLAEFDEAGVCTVNLVSLRDLGRGDQQRTIVDVCALLLRRGAVKEFKETHVREILKRLDTAQKVHSFSLLGLTWEVIGGRLRIVSVKME